MGFTLIHSPTVFSVPSVVNSAGIWHVTNLGIMPLVSQPPLHSRPGAPAATVEAEPISLKTPVKTPVKILQLLKEKPDLTLSELAVLLGKSVSAIERASAKLVKAGELRRVGPDKGGHWEVRRKSEG